MRRVLRIVLMWLLTLAVPVQGIAAARMMHCGPAHQDASVVHAGAHVHDGSPQAHAASHAQHDRHGAHAHDAAVAPDAQDDVSNPAAAHELTKLSCSACAACCTAAALPASFIFLEPVPAHDVMVPPAPHGVAAFLTDGPERPPRSFLA